MIGAEGFLGVGLIEHFRPLAIYLAQFARVLPRLQQALARSVLPPFASKAVFPLHHLWSNSCRVFGSEGGPEMRAFRSVS